VDIPRDTRRVPHPRAGRGYREGELK
jgi:hypothetical protein